MRLKTFMIGLGLGSIEDAYPKLQWAVTWCMEYCNKNYAACKWLFAKKTYWEIQVQAMCPYAR